MRNMGVICGIGVATWAMCSGCAGSHAVSRVAPAGASEQLGREQPSVAIAYLEALGAVDWARGRYAAVQEAWLKAGSPPHLAPIVDRFSQRVHTAEDRLNELDAELVQSQRRPVVGALANLPPDIWIRLVLRDESELRERQVNGLVVKLDDLDRKAETCDLVIRRHRDQVKCEGMRTGDEVFVLGCVVHVEEIDFEAKVARLAVRRSQQGQGGDGGRLAGAR